jgi:AAA15 family ATPase/GTPase
MISKIKFKNFKIFKDWQELELKPITILIGKNNTGKSAVLKLLPLLESSLSGRFDEAVNLKENGVSLADFPNELIYGNPIHNGKLDFELFDEARKLKAELYIYEGRFKIKKWEFNNLSLEEGEKLYIDASENMWHPEFRG